MFFLQPTDGTWGYVRFYHRVQSDMLRGTSLVILVVSAESLDVTDWRGTTIGMVRSIIEVFIFDFDLEEFSYWFFYFACVRRVLSFGFFLFSQN